METVFSKMGLYDLFARGVTGIAVLCAADLFAIEDILSSDAPVWALIIGGYFCGLVLEELSLIREKGFCRVKHKNGKEKNGSRQRIEERICSEYPEYHFENCKRALITNDKEAILDEPLAHIVMSSSFKMACVVFVSVKLIQAIFILFPELNVADMPVDENGYIAIMRILVLIVLVILFSQRERHYCERRTRNIFEYCIAKDYMGIKKEENSL